MKRRLFVGHVLTLVTDEARLCSPWMESFSAGTEDSLLGESWLSLVSLDLVKMVRDLGRNGFSIARCDRELYQESIAVRSELVSVGDGSYQWSGTVS